MAFGEATHGSHDFKELASEVFKRLVEENGFRAFAIEAPLGNIMAIDEYIVYGTGTAKEAVSKNGFWVHDFQEVVDLVEWMRNFNLKAEAGDELHFYGYDIQEIDSSKERYLAFMRKADKEKAIRDEASFGSIDTMNAYTAKNELLFEYIQYADNAVNEMSRNEEIYVQQSSQLEFDFALRNLMSVKWTIELTALTDVERFEFRDKRMYENIKWILEQEEKRGHGMVFVFGHNGHVIKHDRFMSMRPMGVHLAEYYGDDYYVIGTEFYIGKFIAIQTGRGLVEGFLTNDTSELINKFVDSNIDVGVINIRKHIKAKERMDKILISRQLMGSVGSMFSPETPARKNQISVTPALAYDAIIFVRNATPATFVN